MIQGSGVTSGVSETRVQADAMAQAAARFEEANTLLTETLTRLMTRLSGLQTAWVGSGGKAFETVKIQYESDLKKLNQALAETAEAIRTSGVSYAQTDDSAAQMVTKSGGGGLSLPLEN
jgi:WXG100 family type VII secretion target